MKRQRDLYRLYGVIKICDVRNGMSITEAVEEAIKGGVRIVELREKSKSEDEIIKIATDIKEVCHRHNVPLIISGSAKLACRCGVDGVHLGESDADPIYARRILGDDAIIGATAHNLFEAQNALISGVDFLRCGSVLTQSEQSKEHTLEINTLREICDKITIPIIAFGEINSENLTRLRNTGISGVEVGKSIFGQKNILSAAMLMKGLAESI